MIILEGTAGVVIDGSDPLALPSMQATRAKYPQYYSDEVSRRSGRSGPAAGDRVYAWTLSGFPDNVTRWHFD